MKIDKGIPIPEPEPQRNKYPFDKMAVGDSFLVPNHNANTFGPRMAYWQRKFPNRKFLWRTVVENGAKGCRVWRTE